MNNYTTAHAPLRHSESSTILAMQLQGIIARDGSAPFLPTQKAHDLKAALDRKQRGETLSEADAALIAVCASAGN